MVKTLLLTGSEGILGRALADSSLLRSKFNIAPYDIRRRGAGLKEDITDFDKLIAKFRDINPDIVIHTAAYTDVDGCELNPEKAYAVNGSGTNNVARACKETGAFLIYVSSDYIFDGTKKSLYTEEDKPNPINIYGKSKLMGEDFIKKVSDNYLIIRTSWLFGGGGKNFVDTILNKAKTEKIVRVVDDQTASPTYATDLAEAIIKLLLSTGGFRSSVVNITNSGFCSWYEFAKEIVKCGSLKDIIIEPASSEEIRRPAKRPKMSILDNSKFIKVYGKSLPVWQDALRRYCALSNFRTGT